MQEFDNFQQLKYASQNNMSCNFSVFYFAAAFIAKCDIMIIVNVA